jgi:AraC-like DNA-binding protein
LRIFTTTTIIMYTFSNIFHFLLVTLPLVFALQLLTYKNIKSISTKILGILMIVVSFYYLLNANFILEDINLLYLQEYLLFFIFLTVNPLYFIYAKSLTKENFVVKQRTLLHFIPSFVVLLLSFFVDVSIPKEEQTLNGLNTYSIKTAAIIIYNVQVLVYAIAMIVLLGRHHKNIKSHFSFNNKDVNLNWFKVFVVIYIVFSSLDILVYYLKALTEYLDVFYYVLSILFFSFLGYFGVRQRDIYYVAKQLPSQLIVSAEIENGEKETVKKKLITEERVEEIMAQIESLMQETKQYRNQELSIYNLSKELEINKTYLSYVINEKKGQNFSSFINQYRINEAKILLLDKEMENYTIEGIANTVGFNSKSSFNAAFKKYEGMTPSEYKKQTN